MIPGLSLSCLYFVVCFEFGLSLVNVLVRHCLTVLYDENYMEVEFIGDVRCFRLRICRCLDESRRE